MIWWWYHRYKIIKADKGDLKKLRHLTFYSAPMAKKFMEHLQTPHPDISREYDIVQEDTEYTPQRDIEPEDMEVEGAPDDTSSKDDRITNRIIYQGDTRDTENLDTLKRTAPAVDDADLRPIVKLARLEYNSKVGPTFPFQED